MPWSNLQNPFEASQIKRGDASSMLESPDLYLFFFFFNRSIRCMSPLPAKTVRPFITRSLWCQPPSAGSMTSLESSPKLLPIKECDVWSSDSRAPRTSDRSQACPTHFSPSLFLQLSELPPRIKSILKSIQEMHKKSKEGEHLEE